MSRNLAKSITELVETEAAYVADLQTLVEVLSPCLFVSSSLLDVSMKPCYDRMSIPLTLLQRIMKPMAAKRDFMTGAPLVTKEQMECIWSNLTLIPPINAVLLEKMQAGMDEHGADNDKMATVIGMNLAAWPLELLHRCDLSARSRTRATL